MNLLDSLLLGVWWHRNIRGRWIPKALVFKSFSFLNCTRMTSFLMQIMTRMPTIVGSMTMYSRIELYFPQKDSSCKNDWWHDQPAHPCFFPRTSVILPSAHVSDKKVSCEVQWESWEMGGKHASKCQRCWNLGFTRLPSYQFAISCLSMMAIAYHVLLAVSRMKTVSIVCKPQQTKNSWMIKVHENQ